MALSFVFAEFVGFALLFKNAFAVPNHSFCLRHSSYSVCKMEPPKSLSLSLLYCVHLLYQVVYSTRT